MTEEVQDKGDVRQSLIEEYSNYEKDLKLLTYKILLEKFNKKYATLLPEQKKILKEFITSVDSTTKLREYVNSALENVKLQLTELTKEVQDDIIRIKLNEVVENITPVSNKEKVDTETLAILMQYYELIKEIKEA